MKLAKIVAHGRVAEALVEAGNVHVVSPWHEGDELNAPFGLPRRVYERDPGLADVRETLPISDVAFAAPVDPLSKIMCVGLNYADHVGETANAMPEFPTIFQRYADSLVGHDAPVIRPRVSDHYDFEGEIAVVIGKPGRHIPRDAAMGHVLGLSCFMDGSVRDYQKHSLTAGKNFNRSGAIGPWIVPLDEIGTANPSLQTRLNGEIVQSTHADHMIFDIPQIIEYLSRFFELRPGDVIATGTPAGVGHRRDPPLWLKPGNSIAVEVGGVGVLRNDVTAEV